MIEKQHDIRRAVALLVLFATGYLLVLVSVIVLDGIPTRCPMGQFLYALRYLVAFGSGWFACNIDRLIEAGDDR